MGKTYNKKVVKRKFDRTYNKKVEEPEIVKEVKPREVKKKKSKSKDE